MLFSSTVFLFVFLTIVIIGYFNPWWKSRQFRNLWLLAASILFYAWGEPVFIWIMIGSILVNWLISMRLTGNKGWLIAAIVWNLGILLVFKYLNFILSNVGWLLNRNFVITDIRLPIGISFFTFQILSYIFDVYAGKVKPQKSLYKFALYVSMFPQLVAGPIVRYSQIAAEIDDRKENRTEFNDGFIRFVYGLGKKVILSNYMGILADNAFYISKEGALSVAMAWLGAIAYTLQIYYDFSGYSDMAIGLGRMFGFHFAENFNYPYIASSITEFWRRWHISLSGWFRDYVYIPLGGNRKGLARTICNTFAVWLLTGIWHGANWTFIVWGIGYCALILLERAFHKTICGKMPGHIWTMAWVILLWVVFRADSLAAAGDYLAAMFGGSSNVWDVNAASAFSGSWLVLVIAIIFAAPVGDFLAKKSRFMERNRRTLRYALAVPVFIVCIAKCAVSAYNPFIYFNF